VLLRSSTTRKIREDPCGCSAVGELVPRPVHSSRLPGFAHLQPHHPVSRALSKFCNLKSESYQMIVTGPISDCSVELL
jgi:hypothetical protein